MATTCTGRSNLEILNFMKLNGEKKTIEYIQIKNSENSSFSCESSSIRSALKRVIKENQKHHKNKSKKNGQEKLEVFENAEFAFPKFFGSKRKSPVDADTEAVDLAPKAKFRDVLHGYINTAVDCVKEANLLREENTLLKNTPKVVKHTRLNKWKRRAITAERSLLREQKSSKAVMSNVEKKNKEIKKLKLKLKYRETQNNKMQEKILLLQENLTNIKEQKATLEAELAFKETEVKDLIAERDWLSELVDINIVTYNEDRKCFTPDLQQCVYGLLNCNVSCSQITPVIQHALQLANRQANKLPSRSTVNNMNVQRLVLSHRQLSEEFKEKQNTCLLGDETSKYGHKYQGIHSSDADGRIWALGVREMTTKAGQSVLNVLKDILSDIDDASERSDNEVSKEILLNISSTMSDRAATQLKFNELLEEFRTSVLKEKMVDTWETLSLNEQETISKLSNFFCSLHLLVHMAEAAASTLKESDKGFFGTEHPILDKSFLKATEPGAVRLIRIASKAFARGGDEKNGAHLHFETYIDNFLATHKLRSIPLERYRGNRFNIIFSAASNVFFLADKMSAYLEAGASNRLLLALQFDLQIPEYVAGCKALGLISEFITIPLWCCLEDSNISIMDIGVHFKELVAYLEEMDYQKFVEGKYLMTRVDRQKVLNSRIVLSLVKPWEHDDKVHVILQMIIPALTGVVKRLLADHLVGGKWNNPTEDQKYKTLATPKHNKFCESVFGYLDRFIREKPNSTVLAMESYVLFCHNKTLEWLSNKPAGERHSLLEMARKDEKKMREKFKARKKVIELERQQILQEKIQETERKKEARLKKVEHYTNQVLIWGLWQSEEEVDQALLGLKTKKDKIEAITAQLNFRKHVLKQTVDDQSDVYNQSSIVNGKRQKFTIDKFTSNIKKLVRRAYTIQINENDNDTIIVGKKVKHGFEESAETKWYFGQVISQVPGFPSWYNIKYAGDLAIYTYKLLEDYKKGDLRIIV